MAQTLVNIRMDEELKKYGADLSGIGDEYDHCFYYFCKKMTREKRIPFDVLINSFYSERNMHALDESIM